jgi:hypothetical protein
MVMVRANLTLNGWPLYGGGWVFHCRFSKDFLILFLFSRIFPGLFLLASIGYKAFGMVFSLIFGCSGIDVATQCP